AVRGRGGRSGPGPRRPDGGCTARRGSAAGVRSIARDRGPMPSRLSRGDLAVGGHDRGSGARDRIRRDTRACRPRVTRSSALAEVMSSVEYPTFSRRANGTGAITDHPAPRRIRRARTHMSGAMRKVAVYLGLVEDRDRYDEDAGYDDEYAVDEVEEPADADEDRRDGHLAGADARPAPVAALHERRPMRV